jgi:hypothetical protein
VPNIRSDAADIPDADLTNPILKPWAIEQMKRPMTACAPGKSRSPPVRLLARRRARFRRLCAVRPIYFLQTKSEVTIIMGSDMQVRALSSERAAFGQSQTILVRKNRSGTTKAERTRRRYHRDERQNLRRQTARPLRPRCMSWNVSKCSRAGKSAGACDGG